jgi:hypothetical protein
MLRDDTPCFTTLPDRVIWFFLFEKEMKFKEFEEGESERVTMLPVRAHLIHVKNKRLMTLKIFVSIFLEVSDVAKFVQSVWILAPVRQVLAAGDTAAAVVLS